MRPPVEGEQDPLGQHGQSTAEPLVAVESCRWPTAAAARRGQPREVRSYRAERALDARVVHGPVCGVHGGGVGQRWSGSRGEGEEACSRWDRARAAAGGSWRTTCRCPPRPVRRTLAMKTAGAPCVFRLAESDVEALDVVGDGMLSAVAPRLAAAGEQLARQRNGRARGERLIRAIMGLV